MKAHFTKGTVIKLVLTIVLFVILVLLIAGWDILCDIVNPFLISFFIAYLLNPLVCRMEKKGIKRPVGILIIYTIFISFLLFVGFYIIPAMVRDIGKLIGKLPGYNEKFRETIQYIQERYSKSGLPSGIKNAIDSNINRIQNTITLYLEAITTAIISRLSSAFDIALVPILLYYFLKDFKRITKKLTMLLPRKYRNHVVRIWVNIDDVFGNYVRSQIILSLIIGAMTTLAMLALKIDFALIIGILNGITNIIPYFGPIIGTIPAVLIALLQSPSKAIYAAIALTVIQQIESDIISPKIMGDSVGLHPTTVILALIIGGRFFGAPGLILGIPVAAALKIIYRDIMKNMF